MADREKLPYIDLRGLQGLYTKSSPEVLKAEQLRVAQNCDFFSSYGATSKIRGSSRILASQYSETTVRKIPWVGFYKAANLAGVITRHVLVAAGTKLGRLSGTAPSATITTLATGRTENLFHMADMMSDFMYITNQDPDRVGHGDDPVKYDGAVISKWGIAAPGEKETVHDTFDDKDTWTTGHSTLTQELTDGTGVTWDGDATQIDKDSGAGAKHFWLEKTLDSPFYPIQDERPSEKAVQDRVKFLTYIPRGTLTGTDLNTDAGFERSGSALTVKTSSNSTNVNADNWEFYFLIGSLVEGWNKLSLDFTDLGTPNSESTGSTVGDFYPEVDRIKRVRFEYNAVADDTTINDLRIDRLYGLDEGAPLVAQSGSGSLSGVYSYKIVYLSKYGNSSNAGPQSRDFTAASAGQIDLTNIPKSPDPQITGREIYRTVANGSIWLYVDTIYDNTTTTYTDDTPDGSLGNDTPPQAADYSDDNSVPPKAGIVKVWKRTVFMAGDPQNPTTLYFSEDDEPESFPLINTFELDSKITAMYESYSNLIVETETDKWQVIGDNPDFSVDKIIEGMGCVGRRAAGTARLVGYAIDRDGMRLFDGSGLNKISEPIRDKYDTDIDKENIELVHTVHSKSRNLVLQFNPDSTAWPDTEYSSIFAYIYVIDEVSKGYWAEIVPHADADMNFLDAEEIEDANGDFHIYASGDDGMIYELFDSDSKNWAAASGATTYPITTVFETPYIRPGELGKETEGVSGRVEPSFIEVRTDGDATTWTALISMADGPTQTTPRGTISKDIEFGANESLHCIPLPANIPAEYFKVKLTNSQADVFSKILGVRIYYHVRPFPGANV